MVSKKRPEYKTGLFFVAVVQMKTLNNKIGIREESVGHAFSLCAAKDIDGDDSPESFICPALSSVEICGCGCTLRIREGRSAAEGILRDSIPN